VAAAAAAVAGGIGAARGRGCSGGRAIAAT
jgi:hypothetical protein